MCLTVPAKVISINEGSGPNGVSTITVEDSRGVRDLKAVLLPGLKRGDWVLYAYDIAVRKVSEDDAMEILELLKGAGSIDISKLKKDFVKALRSHVNGKIARRDIIRLLNAGEGVEAKALYSEANVVRQARLKDFFCIHGIVEFSNSCVRDCFYCGLRRSAGGVTRYRMTPADIVETVERAVSVKGYKLIVLQSGDDFHYTDDMLVEMIKEIKRRCRVFIFMSVGERSARCYERMRSAGAKGVLFRFETSNAKLYDSIHPGQNFKNRLELLKTMKELGYYVASGFLVGLPGQTIEDIADDIALLKKLRIDMASIGPFVPCNDTPLYNSRSADENLVLKVLAITRLLMPGAKIPVTTALETIDNENGRRLALSSGANSLMFNLTPEKYRGDYRIYPDKYHGSTEVWEKYGLFREELSYRMLEKKMFDEFEAGR